MRGAKGVAVQAGERRMCFKEHLFSIMDERGFTLESLYERCSQADLVCREEFERQCFAEATDLYPSYLSTVTEALGLSPGEAEVFSIYYGFGRTPLEQR